MSACGAGALARVSRDTHGIHDARVQCTCSLRRTGDRGRNAFAVASGLRASHAFAARRTLDTTARLVCSDTCSLRRTRVPSDSAYVHADAGRRDLAGSSLDAGRAPGAPDSRRACCGTSDPVPGLRRSCPLTARTQSGALAGCGEARRGSARSPYTRRRSTPSSLGRPSRPCRPLPRNARRVRASTSCSALNVISTSECQ
jgi:hypothetical protein